MTKRPAFQFYPGDWLADMRIRMLPWASRGLYMELLCYCWRKDWIPADSSAIAQLCGCHDLAIVEPCLQLFQPHPSDSSKLIHQRLVEEKLKQDQYREERSLSGKRGAKLRWDSGMRENTSSSSTSSSTSNTSSNEEVGVEFPANLQTADFGAAWESYLAYRKSSRLKSLAPASVQAQLRNLSEMGHDEAIEAIHQSIANGWQGIFPPKSKKPAPAKAKEVDLSW